MTEYLINLAVLLLINVLFALALNVLMGYLGLVSACHGCLFGVGAYASALLVLEIGLPTWLAVALAGICAGLTAYVIGLFTVRLRRESFVIATFIIQMIVVALFRNVMFTGGPYGLVGIPRPTVLGFEAVTPIEFSLWAAPIVAIVGGWLWTLDRTPYSRALKAMSDSEALARVSGKDTVALRRTAIATSGAVAGVAGALYAVYASFIDPSSFGIELSVLVLLIVGIGGGGNIAGPALGALLLTALPELLRQIPLPPDSLGFLRQAVFGIVLIAMMRFRPQGIWGTQRFRDE